MIKLILFDYGGVIAPEGFQLGVLKFAWKFNTTFKKMYEIINNRAGAEKGYFKGEISEKEYWKIIANELGTDEDLFKYRYLFIDNLNPRAEMIELIKDLQNEYKLGIFSDQTNWLYDLDEKYHFFNYFKYKFISYDVGYTKHDDEFYKIPIQETGYKPEEMLVIDDKERVINKVSEFGMQGYVFTSIEACQSYLHRLLNI